MLGRQPFPIRVKYNLTQKLTIREDILTQAATPRFKLSADYRNYPFLAGLCRVASLPDNWDAADHETGSPGYDPEKITELAEIMLDRAEQDGVFHRIFSSHKVSVSPACDEQIILSWRNGSYRQSIVLDLAENTIFWTLRNPQQRASSCSEEMSLFNEKSWSDISQHIADSRLWP